MILRVRLNITAFAIFIAHALSAQWNPFAGVITPYTATATVITSSSGSGTPGNVIDQNEQTHWQSGSSLPTNYIGRSDQNYFWGKSAWCSGTGTVLNYALLTDGNVNNVLTIPAQNGHSLLRISLPAPVKPVCLSVKMNLGAGVVVEAYAFSSPADSVLVGAYTTSNNYMTSRYNFPVGMAVSQIRLYGIGGSFNIFEVACLAEAPKEFVVVDLGAVKNIGYIETRHWAGGNATATVLYQSNDAINWILVDSLDPNTLAKVPLMLPAPVYARYLKLEHTLNTNDYAKCFVWEIAAYDKYGWMGQRPQAKKSAHTFGAMMGVNSLWGWGHNAYSSATDNGNGPWLFKKAISQGRMYHNLNWDVIDPDATPNYNVMAAGGGTPAQFWLNWDTEYKAWKNAGLETETSIQFNNSDFPVNVWNAPFTAAYNYGAAFAEHFGAPSGNNFVKTLEIGNEPWDYPAPFYRDVLRGMASGAKEADPTMKVFPGALQAAFPNAENGLFKNFTGVRLTEAEAPYLDGLNSHLYCFRNDENGVRRNIHPEAPFSEFWTILADIRFRNANMPGKKIYVTEFGWDSPGGGDNCVHEECVSEKSQAIYGIRAMMLLSRLGIDRFHWYFYGDQYAGTLFARSGMHSLNFTLKRSFLAFQSVKHLLGDKYFLGVEREDDDAYIYKFGDADSTVTHYVAWKPIDGDSNAVTVVSFPSPAAALNAWTVAGIDTSGEQLGLPGFANGQITIPISAVPTVIQINQGSALPVELLRFTGQHTGDHNLLQWDMAPGQTWRTTTLERSNDGIYFSPIHTHQYDNRGHFQYTDLLVPSGQLYYRLLFIDSDHQGDYSPIITLSSAQDGGFIYPNPVKDRLYLRDLPLETPFQLVNSIGQVVRQGDFAPEVLDCSDLAGGVYYLVVGMWKNIIFKL